MLYKLNFTVNYLQIKIKQDEKENNTTVYRKQLFENLKSGRYVLKTQRENETQQISHEMKNEISRYFELNRFNSSFEKGKKCMSVKKKSSSIFFENIFEELKYCNRAFSQLPKINFKLDNIFEIFYSTNIPPLIKTKKNVIVVIENDNSKKRNEGRITCPECLKEETFKELKRKISAKMKEVILLIRKKLLRGLKKKKEMIIEEGPKPSFLIMDDLVAPFPEMETDPIPVFSFAEGKAQERRKCKTDPEKNEGSKQSTQTSTGQQMFYPCSRENLLKANGQEKCRRNEQPISPPPLCPEECLDSPQNVELIPRKIENKDPIPKINYDRNSLEVLTRMPANRENKGYNKGKNNNPVTKPEKNSPEVIDEVQDVSLSNLDLSNPSVTIIPILKPKEKGKRNIIIRLKNVPDTVDVIKIRSIMSSIYNNCETKKYSNYFIKSQEKPLPYDNQISNRLKVRKTNDMTCPNKIPKPSSKLILPHLEEPKNYPNRNPTWKTAPNRITNNLRCYKKNDFFYDE
ncbi:unnamed protein product [Nezara viridula]|uniref:Uncharacterized protein n=1 Tax=Nezara viridula TaxID=85310 RepID=A0A9P0MV37_NEZVI|nr:unnamed protein product [Nezara viridula]